MTFFVNLQVSDPYRRKDFTLELKIFVHSEMKFDLHMGVKMENATCAFLHLASISSAVPPVVVIRLTRYVKADTCTRTSPTQLMLPVFAGDRILISLVLDALTLRPTAIRLYYQIIHTCTCTSCMLCNNTTRTKMAVAKRLKSGFCTITFLDPKCLCL